MLRVAKSLISLLTRDQARRLVKLQFFVVLAACLETVSIMSIAPFMGVVVDPTILNKAPLLTDVAAALGVFGVENIIIALGVIVVLLLALSTLVSTVTLWRLSLFGARFGMELGDRLYEYYISEEWLFHTENNTSDLVKQVSEDSLRVSDNVITPLLLINARLVVCVLIIGSMVLYNASFALSGIAIIGGFYFLIYAGLRKKLMANARQVSLMSAARFRVLMEGLRSIKDIILRSNDQYFSSHFSSAGRVLADARGGNLALAITPRYLIELAIFGALVTLMLFAITKDASGQSLLGSLPTLAFFGFAVFRLMPCVQQVYASSAQVKGNEYAFISIKDHLDKRSLAKTNRRLRDHAEKTDALTWVNKLQLVDVSFAYPNSDKPALRKVSIDIKKGEILGLVGDSGSGKSTLGDLLLGLLYPETGKVLVDGREINAGNISCWRNLVGYVPQTVSLLDTSFAQNIAFGVDQGSVDHEAVNCAIRDADLENLVNSYAEGVDFSIGEGGILISGGQRQRLALARALYRRAQFIVFDEATSALDLGTQRRVMESIVALKKNAAVVMITHSHNELAYCDNVCVLEDGEIIDLGPSKEVVSRNDRFLR